MSDNIDLTVFESADAYVKRIRKNISEETVNYLNSKIENILSNKATTHPFLEKYAKNGLSKEKSDILYLETLHYFKNLPFYVCGISQLTRDEEIFRAVLFNAMDEMQESYSHLEMYYDFLRKRNILEETIQNYECLASTKTLNEGIKNLYSTMPVVRALGALFADETMSAYMVSKYNEGLILEGVSEEDRYFWELHVKVEVGHSNSIFNIIAPYIQDEEGKKLFNEGISLYLYLMEQYWDGIEVLVNE